MFSSILTTFELSNFWMQLGQYLNLARAYNQTTIGKIQLAQIREMLCTINILVVVVVSSLKQVFTKHQK